MGWPVSYVSNLMDNLRLVSLGSTRRCEAAERDEDSTIGSAVCWLAMLRHSHSTASDISHTVSTVMSMQATIVSEKRPIQWSCLSLWASLEKGKKQTKKASSSLYTVPPFSIPVMTMRVLSFLSMLSLAKLQ